MIIDIDKGVIKRMAGNNNIVRIGNTVQPTTGVKSGIFSRDIYSMSDMGPIFQASNIFNRADTQWYEKFNRFGWVDPYNSLTTTREYLFFTKPDLHLCVPGTTTLNPQLKNEDFFVELANRYPQIIMQLQKSIRSEKSSDYNPFMPMLSNAVKNKLDMPEMQASVIDNSATIFGTSIDYRGDAFNSGEKHEFSLEFEDTRSLELYILFRTIEEYAQAKKFGIVSPPNINNAKVDANGLAYSHYIENKELHDQFAIYKFIVGDDFEDIIYYAKLFGVFTKTVPREAFSDPDPNGGLRYNVQFEAQFVDDMKPYILLQFNNLINETVSLSSNPVWLDIYNDKLGDVDGSWAWMPYVVKQFRDQTTPEAWNWPKSMQYKYKLKWRIR